MAFFLVCQKLKMFLLFGQASKKNTKSSMVLTVMGMGKLEWKQPSGFVIFDYKLSLSFLLD